MSEYDPLREHQQQPNAATDATQHPLSGQPESGQPESDEIATVLEPALLEAIVFAADEPVRAGDIAAAFGLDPITVSDAIEALALDYESRGAGLALRASGGGWRLYTRADLAEQVGHFATRSRIGRLSRAALETLAIVAYRQPITRGEVARVRGVNVDSVLRTLQERGLVDEIGRDPGPGSPPVFGTTPLFLEKIGLTSVSQLPPLASFAPDPVVAAEIERALAPMQGE